MGEPRLLHLLVLAFAGGGCSISNMSFEEVQRDLDEVVRIEAAADQGAGPQRRVVYRQEALTSPWYSKLTPLWPLPVRLLRPPLVALFGDRRGPEKLENPAGYARELLAELGCKAGEDLLQAGEAAQRLVPLAELDPSPLGRIVALDGIEAIADGLGLRLLEGVTDPEAQPAAPAAQADLVEVLRVCRPLARRAAGTRTLAPEAAKGYTDALAVLTARPLPQGAERLALVADLTAAWGEEWDGSLRPATEAALRRALQHCLQQAVLAALPGQEPGLAEVRLRALAIAHRAGGPDAVPVLLALLASPPDRVREGQSRYDPDQYVRLRLIHLCGQLDRPRAAKAVRLPGREAWEPVSALDFLCETILAEDPFFTTMRIPAQEALCRCLGKPLDYDLAWVRALHNELRRAS